MSHLALNPRGTNWHSRVRWLFDSVPVSAGRGPRRSTARRSYDTFAPGYEVRIPAAEPLTKYRPGGYHPVHLGTQFKYGRYRVTHKLGWGGEGTVWLARDLRLSRLVALKVLLADESGRNEESALLKRLFGGAGSPDHPGIDHVPQLLDSFWHTGPNGTHECLVLDVAGRNAQDQAQTYPKRRLPARAAWSVARQVVLALDRLHTFEVCHADLHTRNIMLSPALQRYSRLDLLPMLAAPRVADVNALPPNELTPQMPKYLVETTLLPYASTDPRLWHAQLVDFGQSFHTGSVSRKSRTPLVLRAPELLLSHEWDHRIDIWSLACTLFELVTGQPPFNPVDSSQGRLIQEWTDLFGDLPEGWRGPLGYSAQWVDDEMIGITAWLKQFYFQGTDSGSVSVEEVNQDKSQDRSQDRNQDRNQDSNQDRDQDRDQSREEEKVEDFAEQDLESLGDLLEQMFRYRPEERLDTGQILAHAWFTQSPWAR